MRICEVNNVEREIYLAPPQDPATAQTTKVGVGAQPRTEPSQALHHEGGRNVATGRQQANPYGGSHPPSTGGPMAGRERRQREGGAIIIITRRQHPLLRGGKALGGGAGVAPSSERWPLGSSTTLPVRHTRGARPSSQGG